MTLNQLALEMWERLRYQGVDPSVLSRVLKGQRLFTFKQLEVFCGLLSLKEKDRDELQNCLVADLSQRFGLGREFFASRDKHFVDLVEDNLVKIRKVAENDFPCIAVEWAENVYERIQEGLSLNTDSGERLLLLRLLSRVLLEKTDSLLVYEKLTSLYGPFFRSLRELKEVAKELKDSQLAGMVDFLAGDAIYTGGVYRPAIELLKAGSTQDDPKDDYIVALRSFRGIATCYARLGDEEEFKRAKSQLYKVLPKYAIHDQCMALEGIARAQGFLGLSREAGKTLSSAWNLYRKFEKDEDRRKVYRKVQLVRTELELAVKFKDKDKNYLEKLGKEGLVLAREFGYKRYEPLIQDSLHQILN